MAEPHNLGTIGSARVGATDLLIEPEGKITVNLSKAKQTEVIGAKSETQKGTVMAWAPTPKNILLGIIALAVLIWLVDGLRYYYYNVAYPPPFWIFGRAGDTGDILGGHPTTLTRTILPGGTLSQPGQPLGPFPHATRTTCPPGTTLRPDGWCYTAYVNTPGGDPRYDVRDAGCRLGATRSFTVPIPNGGRRRVDQTCTS